MQNCVEMRFVFPFVKVEIISCADSWHYDRGDVF